MPIETMDDLLSWIPPYRSDDIIEKGILEPNARLLIFGPPKTWKSMLVNHLAYCIADGKPWLGLKTTPCLPIVYQAELSRLSHQKRVRKYKNNLDYSPSTVLNRHGDRIKIDTSIGTSILTKDIQEAISLYPNQRIVLIIDPLTEVMSGHVSDEYDCRKFSDPIDRLRERYNISIVIIHHARNYRVDPYGNIIDLGADEMRGSGYIGQWVDSAIKLTHVNPFKPTDEIKVEFVYYREAEEPLPSLVIHWNRHNLQPYIIATEQPEQGYIDSEDVSIRGLV